MTESGPQSDGSAPPAGHRDRRRAIQQAIRGGQDPPPGLEDVALQVALRQSGLRWFVVLYAIGFVVEVVDFVLAASTGTRIRDGVLALLFLLGGYLQWRLGRRAQEAVARWTPLYDELGRYQPDKRSGT